MVKEQGVSAMSYVVVQHPIGGLNYQGVQHKLRMSWPELLRAAREWQPGRT